MTLDDVAEEVGEAILGLEHCFQPWCKLTFLMRNPKEPDGSLIFTSDSFDQIHEAIRGIEEKGRIQYDLRGEKK